MQGNKKHADGQSDSSSIGSLLDETDREVCSLTDRAFKSLCLDELETSYTEAADTVASPSIQHPFSSKYFQSSRNHAIKKNVVSNKLLPQTEEYLTFQQLPKDAQEAKKALTNSIPNIRRKLGFPVPNLHHYKHTSKVSSLIKTFDNVENQEVPVIVSQPIKNNLPKFPLFSGANMALWGSKTILNIPKKLSGFSGVCQSVDDAHRRTEMHKSHHKPMDLLCQGPPHFYSVPSVTSNKPQSSIFTFSKNIAKNRIAKAKELAGKGCFLHSENSAFESWNARHQKLAGMGGSTDYLPTEENLASLEETLCSEESYAPDRKLSPLESADPAVLEQDFLSDAFPQNPLSQISLPLVSLCQSPPLPLSKAGDPLAQPLLPPSSGLALFVNKIPTTPPLPPQPPSSQVLGHQVVASKAPPPLAQSPQFPSETDFHNADTRVPCVTLHPEKTEGLEPGPELGKVCPPWRRQKTVFKGADRTVGVASEVVEMNNYAQGSLSDDTSVADTAATVAHVTSSDPSSPPFNIIQLLTPLLPLKQEKESSNSPSTPPLSEAEAATEPEERTFHCSQNNYKSKAPSLLFNLKDIRKRVKSTYSPAPLLKAFEEKKKIKEPDSTKGRVTHLPEGSRSKSAEKDEMSQKPFGKKGSAREQEKVTQFTDHHLGSCQMSSSPSPKSGGLSDQKISSLQQERPMDSEDGEMVSVAELHPKGHIPSQRAPSSPSEQDACLQNVSLRDPENKIGAQSHRTDVEPRESPNLFFTAEENINESEVRACKESGNEQKGQRSSSSSEQSFVSIVDLPSHEESFSLMQLFQKACLQESQRNKEKGSAEEQPSHREEGPGRLEEALRDHAISNDASKADGRSAGIAEENKEKDTLGGQLEGENKAGRGQGPDSVSEGKSGEPLSPNTSGSFKPNLFKIKDNTFKSPPVIKTVKLPLFRSLSCDGAIAGSYRESERQAFGPFRTTPVIHETDWPLLRNQRQHRTRRAVAATSREADELGSSPARTGSQRAEKGDLAAEAAFQEELRSFYEDDVARTAVTPVQNKDKDHEKQQGRDKEKVRTRKQRPSSTSQLPLERDLAQNKNWSPTREKTNYYKNNILSKHRSGSCAKKVITREATSPTPSETQAHSPAFRDAFGDTLRTPSRTSSTAPSPRSDCTMHSAFTSLLSDTTATWSTTEAEKTATSSSLHRATSSNDNPPMVETSEPSQMSQLSGHTDDSPVMSERPPLMRQMVKTAAKPPAVPPKTEKALRRAKKLANRRKKVEAQQKKPPAEPLLPSEDTTPLPSDQSPLLSTHLSSPVMPSEPNQASLPPPPPPPPPPPLSPTPSSPATQRKLLQDPDSGEYFIVDLPTQFKTLYDPESGRYIQVSLPSSKRDLSQMPPSEILTPPYVLYPSALPLRVSSAPARASPSQLSEPASLVQGALSESAPDWQQNSHYLESLNSQPYLEAAVSEERTQEADGPRFHFERDTGLSDKSDIISLGAIEDFAIEGIS